MEKPLMCQKEMNISPLSLISYGICCFIINSFILNEIDVLGR